jgi:AMP deaminase
MGKSYTSFQEMLDNIFRPMFEATLRPEDNQELHIFLSHVGGIDCVDDESTLDGLVMSGDPPKLPADYTDVVNPPYSYWLYFISANL